MSLPESFNLTAEDAQLLLAANVHLGTKNVQVCYPHQTAITHTSTNIRFTTSHTSTRPDQTVST